MLYYKMSWGVDLQGPMRAFQLACEYKRDSYDTLVFASALRHNITHRSILVDAFVLPLTRERFSKVAGALKSLIMAREMLSIKIESHEEKVLLKLLPVQVECCRQRWNHREDCEYHARGRILLSTEHSTLAICTCREGQDIDNFPRVRNWEAFAKYETRIAIKPLSAIPYVECFLIDEQKRQIQSQLPGSAIERCDNPHLLDVDHMNGN